MTDTEWIEDLLLGLNPQGSYKFVTPEEAVDTAQRIVAGLKEHGWMKVDSEETPEQRKKRLSDHWDDL